VTYLQFRERRGGLNGHPERTDEGQEGLGGADNVDEQHQLVPVDGELRLALVDE